jgi:hypothetical protein
VPGALVYDVLELDPPWGGATVLAMTGELEWMVAADPPMTRVFQVRARCEGWDSDCWT